MIKLPRLLEVRNLRTYFFSSGKTIPAVDGVSFHIDKGETLCVVGESGCGKTVTSLSIMQLIPCPPGRYMSGQIIFEGEDLLRKSKAEMRSIRGNDISMIYQEPMTSLNPVFSIGYQIMETLKLHQNLDNKQALAKAEQMLSLVGISDPARRLIEYPHQLSGGICQRVMIAMGLCCNSKLLIADEPTTALDMTIQAQILELILKLKKKFGMAIMYITHDMGVVAEIAERVIVLYGGKIVEEAPVENIFEQPLHPYTEGLLTCIPSIEERVKELNVIKGTVPSPANYPAGCRFNPRCPYAQPICSQKEPQLRQFGLCRVACHFKPEDRHRNEELE